jgi:hypothetical protein
MGSHPLIRDFVPAQNPVRDHSNITINSIPNPGVDYLCIKEFPADLPAEILMKAGPADYADLII